jgi:hypothetical protein
MRAAEQAERDAAWKAYLPLARKDATTGRLSAAEKAKVHAAIAKLGFNAERTEADAHVFQQEQQLLADAAPLPEAEAEALRIREEGDLFDSESRAVLADLDARRREIRERAIAAGAKVDRAKAAQVALEELHRQHWQLLTGAPPEQVAKRRHLAQCVYARPAAGPYDTIEFEQLMRPWGSIDDYEFVPLPDQSPEDLADLVARAKAIQRSGRTALYLSDDPRGEAALVRTAETIFVGANLSFDHHFKVENYLWQRLPGQTQEQLDALLAKLAKRVAKQAKEARDAELAGRSGASVERFGGVYLGR